MSHGPDHLPTPLNRLIAVFAIDLVKVIDIANQYLGTSFDDVNQEKLKPLRRLRRYIFHFSTVVLGCLAII